MMPTSRAVSVCAFTALLFHSSPVQAQQWAEMKSAHFVVTSNAGQSPTRTLAWQLEQIRSAISALFAWARADLDRPIAIYAVKDERSMRALAPQYWEDKGGIRPVSVWVSAPDQHYFGIRADVQVEDRDTINPHITAYYAYVSLVLQQSSDRPLPLWFSTGFAGVLSNTIVRDTHILFGPPIPWHLQHLREGIRMRLPALMKVARLSPEYTNAELRHRFDAQSWALVHFLIFSDKGIRRPRLDQFIQLVSSGTDVDVAIREALGPLEQLERDFYNYINRSLFTYLRVNADASVERESFPARALSSSESAAALALFHVAMNRPAEARAAIEEARKEALPADSFVAEALLLEREGKREEARAAFERAVAGGTTSSYAYYRLASLRWSPRPDRDTLAGMEQLLLKALALNGRHASSNALFAEVRSLLGTGEPMGFARRAIALAPSEPRYRLTAARILLRQQKYDEALKEAQITLAMAAGADVRPDVEELIATIERARKGPGVSTIAAPKVDAQSAGAAVRLGPGIVPPRLLQEAKPAYTREAMRMRIEGVIRLEAVVALDGLPTAVTPTKCELQSRLQNSTNKDEEPARKVFLESKFKPGECTETFGLDQSAISAVKQWRFAPGTRDGQPLPVLVEIEMSFTLR
jgi:tetratricopeptide (TPR) repeat protein